MSDPSTSNNLVEIFATFITITGTYFITKYQIINPNKIFIKQQQLENVYLPLYRLVIDPGTKVLDKIASDNIFNKIENIIDENYLLLYPDLLESYSDLKRSVETNTQIEQSYTKFCNIIFYDYEKLKRYLGYPSESYKDFFSRVDTPTKLKEILSYFNLLILFSPIVFVVFIDDLNFLHMTKIGIFFFISIFVSLKTNAYLTSIQRRK